MTATDRALAYLLKHGASDCFLVGNAVWPERAGRISANGGGGDYAAQMLLGRMKKAGLVQHAHSTGSTRWEITPAGARRAKGRK